MGRIGTLPEDSSSQSEESTKLIVKEEQEESSEVAAEPSWWDKVNADWRAVIVGVVNFAVVVALVGLYSYDENDNAEKWLLPRPKKWTGGDITEAFSKYIVVGLPLVFTIMAASALVSGKAAWDVLPGFTLVWTISLICLTLNAEPDLKDKGLAYAVTCIVCGLTITNVLGRWVDTSALKTIAGLGEWFIKISLVTLAIEIDVVAKYGAPGILVGWVKSPISIIVSYLMGVKIFKCEPRLAMLIAVGVSWCGASAITAVAPVIQAEPTDVVAAIGIVCLVVLVWTFSLPYMCVGAGFSDEMSGAFLGAAVDQTANVVVAGNIVSQDAGEVAATVKMILNASLGLMCVGVTICWNVEKSVSPKAVWSKFPKFVVGFLLLSTATYLVKHFVFSSPRSETLPPSLQAVSNWWAAVGFTCIGLNTNIIKLWSSIPRGPALLTYTFGGLFDIGLSLLAAYVFFDVWKSTLPDSNEGLPDP